MSTNPRTPAVTVRVRQGRWLAGVAAGLARRLSTSPRSVRAAFVLLSFVALLGPLAYLAFALILPDETGEDQTAGPRTIVLISQMLSVILALVLLIVIGAAAQLFGHGWIAVAAAAAALVLVVVRWPRLGPAWGVLPVAALTLPTAAVALLGLSLTPELLSVRIAPKTLSQLRSTRLPRGFMTTDIDLRNTHLPTAGTTTLTIRSGVGETVIALPDTRCVKVVVDRSPPSSTWRRTVELLGARADRSPVTLFGQPHGGFTRSTFAPVNSHGPTLHILFSSIIGGLTVRDYQPQIDPADDPDWPGDSYVPPRPKTHGLPEADARREIEAWRAERRGQSTLDRLRTGPCGPSRS